MITNKSSVVGSLVKFMRVKTYNPNANKKVVTYGYVTEYIAHGFFAVVHSYPDGEYGEMMVHASQLCVCEFEEVTFAKDSIKGWSYEIGTLNKLFYLVDYYRKKGDVQSEHNTWRNIDIKNKIEQVLR